MIVYSECMEKNCIDYEEYKIMKYLSPTTDIAFKKLFGDEHHKNLTMNFLNNVLNLSHDKLIEEISFRETERLPETLEGKKTYLDVYCIDKEKHHYIIEMQALNEFNFTERAQHYAARALANQLPKGGEYQDILPVVFLGIVGYMLFKDENDIVSQYCIINPKTGKIMHKSLLSFNFVELPKFDKTLEQLETETDKWFYFLKNADDLEVVPQEFKDSQNFKEAFHILDKMQWNQTDLLHYIKQEEAIGRERRQQEGSRKEAAQEGRQEGRQEGIEFIAINGLKKGLDINLIKDLTGLSVEQIEILRKKMQQ